MEGFCGGEFWNTTLTWDSHYPCFTFCFRITALYWIPSIFFLLVSFYNMYDLKKQRRVYAIRLNRLNVSRLTLTLCLAVLSIMEIPALLEISSCTAAILSPFIKSITFFWAIRVINFHRNKGVHNSGLFFLFWFLHLLCGFIPIYTYFEDKDEYTDFYMSLFMAEYIIYIIQFIISFISERIPPSQVKNKLHSEACPVENASFISSITFQWMHPLMWMGFRKTLDNSDLWEIPSKIAMGNIDAKFNRAWEKEVERCKYHNERVRMAQTAYYDDKVDLEEIPLLDVKENADVIETISEKEMKPNLVRILVRIFGADYLKAFACKFFCDILQFCNPLVLKGLINYINDENEQTWRGYLYVALFFTIAIMITILLHQMFSRSIISGLCIKSALVSCLFRKAMTIGTEDRKKTQTGEIVNLMSIDAERAYFIGGYLWVFWSAPFQLLLSVIMLYNEMGYSVFVGISVLVFTMPLNTYLGIVQRRFQRSQLKHKDNRLKTMTEILNGIKVLKLFTWELPFQSKIKNLRDNEINFLKKSAYLSGIQTFIWSFTPFLVMITTFASFLYIEGKQLTASKAFVTVTLFNIMRSPLGMLPMMITLLVQANVSLGRINKFLNYDDLDNRRITRFTDTKNAITSEKCNFSWGINEEPVLKNISFSFKKGSLVAVVGSVGSGKSSLLQSLIGELYITDGTVNISGKLGYVSQQAWIQNQTVRENIIFGKQFKERKYQKIVEACALISDFEMLKDGDATEIGEKGINLSGGQKQRISMARAVYQNQDIYLLDDPLSAVDAHVGKHLFENVVGPNGILRSKTRVLVTHSLKWLPYCDHIVFLEDNEICCEGSFNELTKVAGFERYVKSVLDEEQGKEESNGEELQKKVQEQENELTVSRLDEETVNIGLSSQRSRTTHEELRKEGNVKLAVFLGYVRAIGWFSFSTSIFLISLYQVGLAISNIWLSTWTEDPLLSNPSSNPSWSNYTTKQNMYMGVYGGLGLMQALLILIYGMSFSIALVLASNKLHKSLLNGVMRAPMSFFDVTPVGRILNRFSKDVEAMDSQLPMNIKSFINTFLTVVGTFGVIIYALPEFILFMIPMVVFYYFMQRFFVQTSRQLKRIESTTRSPIFNHFSEALTGISTIRAFNYETKFINENRARVDESNIYTYAGVLAARWLGVRLEFIGSFIVMFTSLFAVINRGSGLGAGIVGLVVSYALSVTSNLNWLVRMVSDVETNIVATERILEYSSLSPEGDWNITNKVPSDWPNAGKIKFLNYSTRYRPGLELVLNNVSFEILPGEKVGIVGRTGAGKSSLTTALFRLIEAAGGSISIDGIDISDVGLHQVRSKLTILPQDPVLFSGSLRSNLDPFEGHTDDDLWRALKYAHLETFIDSTSKKLEHDVGEGGSNLSVGQRQLVCLARSLLHKTKVLVLDEATAAVDVYTDELIQETIREAFSDCTILTIAHRLNTVMDYDRIMVLSKGEIVEFASPKALLAIPDGHFRSMALDAGIISQ